jgi:hypothetical protein
VYPEMMATCEICLVEALRTTRSTTSRSATERFLGAGYNTRTKERTSGFALARLTEGEYNFAQERKGTN